MYINLYMHILLTEYLCSDAVFDLSKRNLTEVDIKILEKRLGYAPIQNKMSPNQNRILKSLISGTFGKRL